MSFSNPDLTQDQAKQFGQDLKNYYNNGSTSLRAIIYKDWRQIANMSFKDITQEEALIQINKIHTNITRIVWY